MNNQRKKKKLRHKPVWKSNGCQWFGMWLHHTKQEGETDKTWMLLFRTDTYTHTHNTHILWCYHQRGSVRWQKTRINLSGKTTSVCVCVHLCLWIGMRKKCTSKISSLYFISQSRVFRLLQLFSRTRSTSVSLLSELYSFMVLDTHNLAGQVSFEYDMVQMTLAKRHVYLCSGAHFLIHTRYFQMKPIRQSLLCINPIYPAFGVCVPNMILFHTDHW